MSEDNNNKARIPERLGYLESILRFSPDMIVCGDRDGKIVEFNKGAERLLGYPRSEVLGKPITNLYFDPKDRARLINILQRQGQVVDYETRLKNRRGRIIYISTSVAYIYDREGKIIGTIGIAKDIRRRKELERKLARLAITDGLTNLYDRGYFNTSLPEIMEKAKKTRQSLGCIMIDLDGFKEYNDTEGHLGGDNVLKRVGAIILKNVSNKIGVAYRYGGDEFIMLIIGRKQAAIASIAERIRSEIENNFGKKITASIGIALWQSFQSSLELVKNADNAMYRAKSYGGNRVSLI